MSKGKENNSSERTPERLSRWGRNFNALGAVAIAGVALVIPGPNVVLAGWAGVNAAQAACFELLRRKAKKSPKK